MHSLAGPMMRLATPAGTPASSRISKSLMRLRGVSVDGRHTQVQPAARAGAILRAWRKMGKFHGEIMAHTPMGCLRMNNRLCRALAGTISPWMRLPSSA